MMKKREADGLIIEYLLYMGDYDTVNLMMSKMKNERPSFSEPIEARITLCAIDRLLSDNESVLSKGIFSQDNDGDDDKQKERHSKTNDDEKQKHQRQSGIVGKEISRLEDMKEFWSDVSKMLGSLNGISPMNQITQLMLKLSIFFIDLHTHIPSLDSFDSSSLKPLLGIVRDCVGDDAENTMELAKLANLDKAFAALLNSSINVDQARTAFERIVDEARNFSLDSVVSNIRDYLDNVKAALGRPTLLIIEDDISKGLYRPGTGLPDCAKAAATLRAGRESLARVVNDPLPSALSHPASPSTVSPSIPQPNLARFRVSSPHQQLKFSGLKGMKRSSSKETVQPIPPKKFFAPQDDDTETDIEEPNEPSKEQGIVEDNRAESSVSDIPSQDLVPAEQNKPKHVVREKPMRPILDVRIVDGSPEMINADKDLLDFVKSTEPAVKGHRLKRPFSKEEERYLREGVKLFGVGAWKKIRMQYPFQDRSTVDLKDKWRNIVRNDRREEQRRIEDIARNGLQDSDTNSQVE